MAFGRAARRTLLLGAALLVLASCAENAKPRDPRLPPVVPRVGTVVEGVASWYGPGYHGRRTSSGEMFDQDALTAAHYEWAFGTQVRVTLLSSGKSVVVRINDRFPKFKGRVLDLSRGAARAIGLIGPGTGQVRLEVIG
jgi:peptidoglycan lytic transglycosylase